MQENRFDAPNMNQGREAAPAAAMRPGKAVRKARRRVKSPALQPNESPDVLQDALDKWASAKGLDECGANSL